MNVNYWVHNKFGCVGMVLLGGGFGERLGIDGVKTGVPSDMNSMTNYIQLYIKILLAFQERARQQLSMHVQHYHLRPLHLNNYWKRIIILGWNFKIEQFAFCH